MRSRAVSPLPPPYSPRRYLATSSRASTAWEISSSMESAEYISNNWQWGSKGPADQVFVEFLCNPQSPDYPISPLLHYLIPPFSYYPVPPSIARQTASANALVVDVPPRSRVRASTVASVRLRPSMIRPAAASSPRWRSINRADRSSAVGFA